MPTRVLEQYDISVPNAVNRTHCSSQSHTAEKPTPLPPVVPPVSLCANLPQEWPLMCVSARGWFKECKKRRKSPGQFPTNMIEVMAS